MCRVHDERPAPRRTAALWCVGASLAGLMLAGCGIARHTSGPSAPEPGLPVPVSVVHRLTAIADGAVRVNGGDAPVWASAVVTTHEKALTSATPGDTEPTGENTVVYLVTMRGHFVDGRYLSIVVDARTFETTDIGLAAKPPPVAPASFGPVTYLKVSTHRRPGPVPSSRCPPGFSCPSPPLPRLTYVTAVNGQSATFGDHPPLPRYHVRPGEHLLMTVAAIVPRNLRLTALWLGISRGNWGIGPGGRPTGMKPILAHSRRSLPAGMHSFGLRWRVPEGQRSGSLYIVSAWSSDQPFASSAGAIAVLMVR
jgi:hypothetical protein